MQLGNECVGLQPESESAGLEIHDQVDPSRVAEVSLMMSRERERRWFVLERPRRDTNGGSETEVTVT